MCAFSSVTTSKNIRYLHYFSLIYITVGNISQTFSSSLRSESQNLSCRYCSNDLPSQEIEVMIRTFAADDLSCFSVAAIGVATPSRIFFSLSFPPEDFRRSFFFSLSLPCILSSFVSSFLYLSSFHSLSCCLYI